MANGDASDLADDDDDAVAIKWKVAPKIHPHQHNSLDWDSVAYRCDSGFCEKKREKHTQCIILIP